MTPLRENFRNLIPCVFLRRDTVTPKVTPPTVVIRNWKKVLLGFQFSPKSSPDELIEAAESGNLEDFARLFLADPNRLEIRDSRGRAAVHQAAARNKVNILQFIHSSGGGELRVEPSGGQIVCRQG
ncbi:hypothetical protein RUM44_009378 [Polyplax serrata]|uniref:Uncharacterized protein n=1 Tax=Polyplax serrata TaxID=468196 RepID=A0ABR1AT50_POLSC